MFDSISLPRLKTIPPSLPTEDFVCFGGCFFLCLECFEFVFVGLIFLLKKKKKKKKCEVYNEYCMNFSFFFFFYEKEKINKKNLALFSFFFFNGVCLLREIITVFFSDSFV